MTSREIFKEYFQSKLIIWGGVGVAATAIRIISGHKTSFVFVAIVILCILIAAAIMGYIKYNFYERSAPGMIAQLIDKSPLAGFQNVGFSKEEGNMLEGDINNYKVIFSPVVNFEGEKWLVVLIPLEIREGLDSYFIKYNDEFKFKFSDDVVFAEAILKDYEKLYEYEKLFELIDTTTRKLREDEVRPLTQVTNEG